MTDEIAWGIWASGAIILFIGTGAMADLVGARAAKITAILFAIWVLPVAIRAWLMVLAA